MGKKTFSLSFSLTLLLDVLESIGENSLFTNYMNIFSIIFYFTQIVSYIACLNFSYHDSKMDILMKFFYYSNFANFLVIFKSRSLVVLCYILVIFSLSCFFLYLVVVAICKLFFKKSWRKIGIFNLFNQIFARFFTIFYWILVIPFIEILMNPLNCGMEWSYIESCKESFSSLYLILSIFGIFMIVIIGIIHLYIHCNFKFLCFYEIRLKFTILSLLFFIIRMCVSIFFPYFYENDLILIILLHIFSLLSFFNYFQHFPIRSPILSSLYLSCLTSFESTIICLMFWKYFKVLEGESLFYLILLGFILSFKLAFNYTTSKRYDIFLSNFSFRKFIDYALEEVFYLFNNHHGSIENFFLLLGLLKFHAKVCTNPVCKLKAKTMKKFQELPLLKKNSIINSFILQRFSKEIEKECKNKDGVAEVLIFKYISFLIHSNCNTSKVFYETQKIRLLYQYRSFLGSILIEFLLKKVQRKIHEIEKEKFIAQHKTSEKSLEVSSFFRIYREKNYLEKKMQKLLERKIQFWETYKEGFDSYDELFKAVYKYLYKILVFQKNLNEIYIMPSNNQEKVVTMRYLTIFYCIIQNHLPESLKLEEQIDNIRKRYMNVDKDKLSPNIFLKDHLVVCEASFLNIDGKILETSKTEKFAKFFGYELQDLKLVTSIHSLMPSFIAEYHSKLIFWSFVKTRKEQIACDWEVLTHAVDKEGFIFPIKLFLGFNFHYMNDYVANAGIMKLQEDSHEEALLSEEGMLLGINREFFNFFKNEYPSLQRSQLEMISFYSLAPRIKEIIESENIFKDRKTQVIRNMECILILPANLICIIELLNFYQLEIDMENNTSNKNLLSAYISSTNTLRTNKSHGSINNTKSKSRSTKANKDLNIRLNNFLSKFATLSSKKEAIIEIFNDHACTTETLMNKMIDLNGLKKCKIAFDLTFRYHRYGKATNNVIKMTRLNISKISQSEKVENDLQYLKDGQQSHLNQKEESFISVPLSNVIVMPPQNEPGFNFEFERISLSSKTGRSQKSEGNNDKVPNSSLENAREDKANNNKKKHLEFINQNTLIKTEEKEFGLTVTDERKANNDIQKISDNDKFKKKYSIKSSFKSSEDKIKKIDVFKNQTTEQFMLKEIDLAASQKSSSSTSAKKAFNVLLILNFLQKNFPKSMFLFRYLLWFQVILILAYCVIYYMIAGKYISGTYIPLKTSVSNQLQINQGVVLSTTIFMQLENVQKGYANISNFYMNEMYIILNYSYANVINLFYQDRNSDISFSFMSYFQDMYVYYIDYVDYGLDYILISDLTDDLINTINICLSKLPLDELVSILNVPQRNFFYYLVATKTLRDEIQSTIESSNKVVSNELMIVLSVALSFVGLWKLMEYGLLTSFYQKLTRLLNIFLRVGVKEAINEIFFLKEILEILKNQTNPYMMVYFTDQVLNKKNYILGLEDTDVNVKKEKNKEKRKNDKRKLALSVKNRNHSSVGLKPFSKINVLIFLSVSITTSVCYFVFDYYFWMTCNSKIQDLLARTALFNNLYIYSSSVLTLTNLFVREQIIQDPFYEATNEYYQIHTNRLNELSISLDSRRLALEDFIRQLPTYTLTAESDLNDPIFNQIIQSNICEVLELKKRINNEEKDFCISTFNGAFNKGILSVLNEYINQLKSLDYMFNLSAIQTNYNQNFRTQQIMNYIQSDSYPNIILSSYLLNHALLLFYEYFSDYYLQQLYLNIGNLTIFLWIICSVCLVFMGSLLYVSWNFLKKLYVNSASSLSLIPLEKLSFDEQTIFLIKSFYKDHV